MHDYLNTNSIYCCTGACNFSLSLPLRGLVYNTSSSFDEIVPSGEQIWFGCEQGFYPRDPMVATCQEDRLWYPDPSELICHSKHIIPCSYQLISTIFTCRCLQFLSLSTS